MSDPAEAKGWELERFRLADVYLLRAYQLPLTRRTIQFALAVARKPHKQLLESPSSIDSDSD
jgi:hypothetical protein